MNKHLEKILKNIKKFIVSKSKAWFNEVKSSILANPLKKSFNLIIALFLIFLIVWLYKDLVGISIILGYVFFAIWSIRKAIKNPLKIILWFFVYVFLVELRNLTLKAVGLELKNGSLLSAVIILLIMLSIYWLISRLKK